MYAMQTLIQMLHMWCTELHIECNTKKTESMIFQPRSRYVTDNFPNFVVAGCALNFVCEFRYLVHVSNDNLDVDDDIRKEIKCLFERTDIVDSATALNLRSRFYLSLCVCACMM